MSEKRPADEPSYDQQLVKRQNVGSPEGALARFNASVDSKSIVSIQNAPRSSKLAAPVMQLSGHSGEIFTAKFDHSGQFIASGSMDKSILLWKTYGECENYGILNGHKGAVLDVHWSRDSGILYSASADTHLASWDLESGSRIRRYVGSEGTVNSLDTSKRGEEILFSGADDGSIGVWDPRTKHAADYIETPFPITSICVSETGNEVYTGSIANDIEVWDIRKKSVLYALTGHSDTVTSLEISPDQLSLLSFGMDATVRTWDIRPFVPTSRLLRTLDGANIGIEKNLQRAAWNHDGKRLAAASGDGSVLVWSNDNGKLLYKLPGHKSSVNAVDFSPTEPILLSASTDRTMLLGELR